MTACRYDQDFDFVPKTQAAYMLMLENGQQELRRISPTGNIDAEWGERLGLGNPTDIAGNGVELWLSRASQQELLLVNLDTETTEETFSLGELQAHYLTIGTQYLLLSDTINKQLGFFHLKKRKLTTISQDEIPRKAVYRSAKFFLILGDQSVAIYSEEALTPFETLSFSRPVIDLALDNRFTTWVYMRDSQIYRSAVSWNTHAVFGPEEQVAENKISYSPYRRANFGKEFLGLVFLADGRLSNFPNPLADDFAVDFFEAKTYFTYQDSLRLMEIFPRQFATFGPFKGSIRNAYFYVSEANN